MLRDAQGPRIVRTAVAGVSKNLLSVSQLVDAGHEVIFSPKKSIIRHIESGRVKEMERINGVFEVSYEVEPYAAAQLRGEPGRGAASSSSR